MEVALTGIGAGEGEEGWLEKTEVGGIECVREEEWKGKRKTYDNVLLEELGGRVLGQGELVGDLLAALGLAEVAVADGGEADGVGLCFESKPVSFRGVTAAVHNGESIGGRGQEIGARGGERTYWERRRSPQTP